MNLAKTLLVMACGSTITTLAAADSRRTNFDPARNGFRFYNTFTNDFIPQFNIQTKGLCGGMSYAALDYYLAKKPIPTQDYRPANGTPLQQYLYNRQVTSLTSNADKWAEVIVNPFGSRNSEFFNWGLKERLQELRSYIDRGVPVPLGLKAVDSGDHQVLAIGYDTGRYKGDLGKYEEELKIFICDPNHPGRTMTLMPNVSKQEYSYAENTGEHWRTYFVDGKYQRATPPDIRDTTYPSDGTARELLFTITTGADDLRGGNDNVDLTIKMTDGSSQNFPNINLGRRWLPNYTETALVTLKPAVRPEMIGTLILKITSRGGISGDNWDMQSLTVKAIGGGISRDLLSKPAGFYRFTGDKPQLVIPVR